MYIEGVPVLTNVRVFTGTGNTSFTNEACIVVNKASGAATTVTLPAMTGSKLSSLLWVVDGKGDSYTNNITIDGSGSETINGATTFVLAKNYGAVGLIWNGTEWNIHSQVQTANVIDFTGATGVNEIHIPTNLADALSIEDSGGDLMKFDTTTGTQVITITPILKQGTVSADLAAVKGTYISGTVSVAVPSITDPDIAKVDVDTSAMTFACAIGDAVIVMPSEALPTNCRLLGAWVTAADSVQVTFGSEGGNVVGASKNMKFLFHDLT